MRYKSLLGAACLMMVLVSKSWSQRTPSFEDRTYQSVNGELISYRLYLPNGYENSGREYPIVTWINGSGGDVGGRPQSLVDSLRTGDYPGFLLEPFGSGSPFHTCSGAGNGEIHVHCIPELPRPMELLLEAIEEVESIYPIDSEKRVLSGYSAGGVATFNTLRERPDFFAAAVPIASGHEARRFREPIETRIWSLHGHDDAFLRPQFSNETIEAIAAQGGPYPIHLEPRGGHDASFRNVFFLDRDDEVYRWMFEGVTPSLAKLIYDAKDGNVQIDATTAPGGSISRMLLTAVNPPAVTEINGDPIDLRASNILYEASGGEGFQGTLDLGPILPPGLSFTEVHEQLRNLYYRSPASREVDKPFRIEVVEPDSGLRQSVVEEPWLAYRVNNSGRGSDLGLTTRGLVGGSRDSKIVKKFLLPDLAAEEHSLTDAKLRVYVDRVSGSGQVQVGNNPNDNDFLLAAAIAGRGAGLARLSQFWFERLRRIREHCES